MRRFKLMTYDKNDNHPEPWTTLVWVSSQAELIAAMTGQIAGQYRVCHADPL